jgi:hypothetical protein
MTDGSQVVMHASIVGGISYLNSLVIIETFIFTPKVSQDLIPTE